MRRPGLTLVEIVVALAIMALLAVGVLQAVTHLARTSRQQQTDDPAADRQEALRHLVEMDLGHAERVKRTETGFEVEGLARLDRRTLALVHQAATVSYAVQVIGESRWLIRTQQAHGQKTSGELVASGVSQVTIEARGGAGKLPLGQWAGMPEQVTVTITFTGGHERVVQHKRK